MKVGDGEHRNRRCDIKGGDVGKAVRERKKSEGD